MDFTAEWSRHGAGTLGLYEPQGSRPYAATTAGTKYPNDYAPPDTRAAISELPVPVPVARAGRDPGAGGHAVHPTTFLGASYASPAAEAAKAYSWWQDRFGWAPAALENLTKNPDRTIAAVDTSRGTERPMYLEFQNAGPAHFESNSPLRWLQAPLSSPGIFDWAVVGEEIRHSITAPGGGAPRRVVDFAARASNDRLGAADATSYRLRTLDEALAGVGALKAGFARLNSGVPLPAFRADETIGRYLSMGPEEYGRQILPVDVRLELDYLRDAAPRDRDALRSLYRNMYEGVVRLDAHETLPMA